MNLEALESSARQSTTVVGNGQVVANDVHIEDIPTPFKRTFDIAVAIAALIFFAPLIAVFSVMIRIADGHPAVFAQHRRGKNGKMFRCYKLRSMIPNATEELKTLLANDLNARREWNMTQKLQDDPRITRIGKFIRKTSIDELPQFINVLKGDMSIVGPRPIVESEVSKYGSQIASYDAVKPGITGLWQVSGRSGTSYSARVELDSKYARDRNFWSDVKIVIMTIPAVLFSRGAV